MADKAVDRLVWVDCEMTGLDLRRDALIEIAALVTDSDLHILDDGIDLVIAAPAELLDGMQPVVQEMHARSGLSDAVRSGLVIATSRPEGYRRWFNFPASVHFDRCMPVEQEPMIVGRAATKRGRKKGTEARRHEGTKGKIEPAPPLRSP